MELCALASLSSELFLTILSYLWFPDIFLHLNLSCSTIHQRIMEEISLLSYEKFYQLASFFRYIVIHQSPHDDCSSKSNSGAITSKIHLRYDIKCNWLNLSKKITTWPLSLDLDHMPLSMQEEIKWIEVSKGKSTASCVLFHGQLDSNRSIVADTHFPCLIQPNKGAYHKSIKNNVIQRTQLPFIKPLLSPSSSTSTSTSMSNRLIYSCVAYFEIKVYPTVLPPNNNNIQHIMPPCVCIGLISSGFNVRHNLPGWKLFSFGYHGDDGNFFNFSRVEDLGTDGEYSFGANDIVGCGLFYPPFGLYGNGGIFFTKNGELVHEMSFRSSEILGNTWYPSVGLDSYNPVEYINGIDKPFIFDIQQYETSLFGKFHIPTNIDNFYLTGCGIENYLPSYHTKQHIYHPILQDPWDYLYHLGWNGSRIKDDHIGNLVEEYKHARLNYFDFRSSAENRIFLYNDVGMDIDVNDAMDWVDDEDEVSIGDDEGSYVSTDSSDVNLYRNVMNFDETNSAFGQMLKNGTVVMEELQREINTISEIAHEHFDLSDTDTQLTLPSTDSMMALPSINLNLNRDPTKEISEIMKRAYDAMVRLREGMSEISNSMSDEIEVQHSDEEFQLSITEMPDLERVTSRQSQQLTQQQQQRAQSPSFQETCQTVFKLISNGLFEVEKLQQSLNNSSTQTTAADPRIMIRQGSEAIEQLQHIIYEIHDIEEVQDMFGYREDDGFNDVEEDDGFDDENGEVDEDYEEGEEDDDGFDAVDEEIDDEGAADDDQHGD